MEVSGAVTYLATRGDNSREIVAACCSDAHPMRSHVDEGNNGEKSANHGEAECTEAVVI